MIKTLIVDLGGVYFTDGSGALCKKLSERFGIDQEKIQEVILGELSLQYRRGEITVNEFWDGAKKTLGIDESNDVLNHYWLESYVPIEGTVQLLRRVRKAGYELIYLSNNVKERAEFLDGKYQFTQDFDDGVFSHLVKVSKPNPKIYKLAIEKASNPLSECLFIDDKQKFVDGAKQIGLDGVQFTFPEQLEDELKKRGMTF